MKSGLIRGVVFLEGSSLGVFCCLIAYERKTTPLIRPDFICNEIAKYY
jgi:hypothetical protein